MRLIVNNPGYYSGQQLARVSSYIICIIIGVSVYLRTNHSSTKNNGVFSLNLILTILKLGYNLCIIEDIADVNVLERY